MVEEKDLNEHLCVKYVHILKHIAFVYMLYTEV